jgi:hypothetical protein|uniref:Uncharacterized protein n=1 Tax=viral metagenome TaxID=1070528 RepID=A0A6C0BRB5_9ZZZZ
MSIQQIDGFYPDPKQPTVQQPTDIFQIYDIFNDEKNSIKSSCLLLCGLSCFVIFMFILINMTFSLY